MMEKEEISDMLVYNSTLTWLLTQGDFSIFIQHESLQLNDCMRVAIIKTNYSCNKLAEEMQCQVLQ
jgi:hypothetical protein